MFRLDELSGHLIRSGRFKEAIPRFYDELDLAVTHRVITFNEFYRLSKMFAWILLNPSDYNEVETLADQMISLALRIPAKVQLVTEEEFTRNVKKSRENSTTSN